MRWEGATRIGRFGGAPGAAAKLIAMAGRVGVDPGDSSDAAKGEEWVRVTHCCLDHPHIVLCCAGATCAGSQA